MHHGYYPGGSPRKDHTQAQVDMVERSLDWAGVTAGTGVRKMLDVGCGIGGSSRHIARRHGCEAHGITLSPVQAARANDLTANAGLEGVSFQVGENECSRRRFAPRCKVLLESRRAHLTRIGDVSAVHSHPRPSVGDALGILGGRPVVLTPG